MSRRRTLVTIARMLALALWLGYWLFSAIESKAWWHALFAFGLGCFIAQVAIALVQLNLSGRAPGKSSEFERRLSQFFVLLAAIGLLGILVTRYK